MIKTLRDYAHQYQLGDAAGAWVASDPNHGDYDRCRGYRKAGVLLLQQAADSRVDHHLIYPALAVYRQYYELQLKELARVSAKVLAEETESRLSHGLPALLGGIAYVIWHGHIRSTA